MKENIWAILLGKLKGQFIFGTLGLEWSNVENKMKGKGWEAVDYSNMAQSRNRCQTVLNTVINLRVLQNFDYA